MIFTIPKNKKSATKTTASAGITQPREYSYGQRSSDFSVFDNIMPKDQIKLNRLYRNIYKYDSVSGAAVDLMSVLPFSEYSISGVNDKAILSIFLNTCDHLNIQTIMPQLCVEYLTIGKLIGTLVFNGTHGIFTDLIIQDPDYCETTPIPLQGYDPKVDIRVPPEFRKFLTSQDPRDKDARSELPDDLIRSMLSGKVALDPLTTIYIARKTFPKDTGTSYLSRIVPFYMLEQILLEGTIQGAQRRQRAITHIQMGSDEWDPSDTEIDDAIEMVMAADMDPVGAVIATKRDIDISEFRSGGDFWKVTDEWDGLTQAKMRSLGINECLVGDTPITTKDGYVNIGDICDKNLGHTQDIYLDVLSRYRWVKAVKWRYSGKLPVLKITTEIGKCIICTYNHPILVYENNLLYYKKASTISSKDTLIILEEVPIDTISCEAYYKFSRVVGTQAWGESEVYDLQIEEGEEPAFVANNIIVHNSFLAGDACLTGDTLVATEEFGIKKIDSFFDSRTKGVPIPLKFTSHSVHGYNKSKLWLYSGKAKTIELTTSNGYSNKATPEHKIPVLCGDLTAQLIPIQDIKVGNYVIIPTKPVIRKTQYELPKFTPIEKIVKVGRLGGKNCKMVTPILPHPNSLEAQIDVKYPTYMNKYIAEVLGYLVSEGFYSKSGTSFKIGNSNKLMLCRISLIMEKIFGYKPRFRKVYEAGKEYKINGKKGTHNLDFYELYITHAGVVRFFKHIGLVDEYSKRKEIPYSILEADCISQKAFMGAYIEGDGCLNENGSKSRVIHFCSHSKKMCRQFQILLQAHGFISRNKFNRVTLTGSQAKRLYEYLDGFIITKKTNFFKTESRTLGIPNTIIKNHLIDRGFLKEDDKYGKFGRFINHKILSYDNYKLGVYDSYLENISKVDYMFYLRLKHLFELEHFYDNVVSLKLKPKNHIYDISMENQADPVFIANGMLVKNTYNCIRSKINTLELGSIPIEKICDENNGRYQNINLTVQTINGHERAVKWFYNGEAPTLVIKLESGKEIIATPKHRFYLNSYLMDFAANLKVGEKLLTVNGHERIISITHGNRVPVYDLAMANGTSHTFAANGIISSNTMEAALSVFIEQLRSFRLYMTQKIFYHKIFPSLARVHRFVKRKQSELDHGIRITGLAKDPADIPVKDLIIPDIQWHKQLQPQYDESHLSILSTVQEQGVPIPLRVWAAAGGFSIEKILDGLNEDVDTRTKISEYKKKVQGLGGGEEEAGWSIRENNNGRRRLPSKDLLPALARAATNAKPKQVQKLLTFRDKFIKEPNMKNKDLLTGSFK